MKILILIVVSLFILERIFCYLRGPHLVKERINEIDYKTIHKNDSKIIVNNHYHDSRRFIYNDNRSYHYEDNSRNFIDQSRHIDSRKILNIENFNPDLSRHLTQSLDFSKHLELTSVENNLLSPKTTYELDRPIISILALNEKKQLKP